MKVTIRNDKIVSITDVSGDGAGYKDGTYTGEADGFGGTVAVEVTVKDGKIEAVEVTSAENSF